MVRELPIHPHSCRAKGGALIRFTLPLLLAVAGLAGAAVTEQVTLDTGTGTLAGSILIPEGSGPFPVVLIIAGSGPTDRNGNSAMIPAPNNSLRQLAEGLAAAGVASLRYDKRGVAASEGAALSEYDLRFDHLIDDARRWCVQLQADSRFSSLTVAGHSQGAQVGSNAAWLAAADGFVAMAGLGRPVFDVLREQLAKQLPMRNRVKAEAVMDSLSRGRLVDDPPQELMILFRPSVQPYLISWQKFDPQADVARFDGPVTIIQGATDIQVSLEDAELLAAAQPRAKLVLLEGINHIFKPVEGTNPLAHQLSLGDSTKVVSPEAVTAVVRAALEAEAYHQEKAAAVAMVRGYNGILVMNQPSDGSDFAEATAIPTTGGRVGFWARRFLAESQAEYRFGLAEDGYVSQGRLVLDDRMDCVSLMYRCTELARASGPDDALMWALRTRFSGAPLAAVIDSEGAVDYDRPEHLDFSLDMIRTGIWGRDVTHQFTGAGIDTVGSSRYPAGSFSYVSQTHLKTEELAEGDIVWLVLDPADKKAASLRQEYGLVIGHIGIVVKDEGETWLVHAASSDLSGCYQGGQLVRVPLRTYLDRVERYGGVKVTRL